MKTLTDRPCPFCGGEPQLGPGKGPHKAEVRCGTCTRHLGWIPKRDDERRKRPAAHRDLVSRFGRGFCELCLRRKEELSPGETLEGQHVLEYRHEGEPVRENVWIVCSACHRLIHWARGAYGRDEPTPEAKPAPTSGTPKDARTAADDEFDREWGG